MDMIGPYKPITEWNGKNAGTCMWCFAIRNGKEYFIKQFPEPRYPTEDAETSPKLAEKKKARCKRFEEKKTKMYSTVNKASDGNVVRITELFRVEAQYYMAMPRVNSVNMEPEDISKLPDNDKRRLCTVIAHAVAQLHSANFAHSDIKHENVLFTRTTSNKLTAKLIDYDEGFFEDNPPSDSEEVGGQWKYFSPEAWALLDGADLQLSCKIDIFALGILFHEYYTGKIPKYDEAKYKSAGESLAAGQDIGISTDLPKDIRKLIVKMLSTYPDDRPTALEVHKALTQEADMTYKVCHEVEGIIKDTYSFTQKTGSYGNQKITIQKGSLVRKSYKGYKYSKTVPYVVEGETVNDGSVITLKYVKDTTQRKTVSYTVQHKVDGKIIESATFSKPIWVNDPAELPIEVGSITQKSYPSCVFESIDTALKEGSIVPHGKLIVLKYHTVKTSPVPDKPNAYFESDGLGREGYHSMGDL